MGRSVCSSDQCTPLVGFSFVKEYMTKCLSSSDSLKMSELESANLYRIFSWFLTIKRLWNHNKTPLNIWGCSSVVERMLCMYEAPGSIPGISIYFNCIQKLVDNVFKNLTIIIVDKMEMQPSVFSIQIRISSNFFVTEFTIKRLKGIGGLVRELNPGPRAPEARIIPLDQRAGLKLVRIFDCWSCFLNSNLL